jgi:glycosyltransferase involved in cell wall biosynthesis
MTTPATASSKGGVGPETDIGGLVATSVPPRSVALTVVIPTLNEAGQIADAVRQLCWAEAVIVVDGGSTDETGALAAGAGARVLTVCGQTIADQRNAGIAAARTEWVLALDADERVSPELRDELAAMFTRPGGPGHAAFRMKFRNYYLGQELRHGPWGRDWHIRLFTRERRYLCHRVHEHLEAIDDVGTLEGAIIHYPYRDIGHHVTKIVKYARWGADDLYAQGRRAGMWQLTARPAWRFCRDYMAYSGWRDGTVGFVAAALGAFAAFLKYAFLFSRSRAANE